MLKLSALIIGILSVFSTVSNAADLALEPRVVTAERMSYSGDRLYFGRGVYQDSGWAYETPVVNGHLSCRVRIIQRPYGIERIRHCPY
jgi:hypothetical protein